MKSFYAFWKKEWLESARSGKLLLLFILFILFGIMNPAIAKLTPWMLELLSDSLAESGMSVTGITVDALTSWTQFFKNLPIALIVFVLIYSNTFTREYENGSLVLVLTKGLPRCKVVLAKTALLLPVWSLCYWLCFGITCGYNCFFWDNSIAKHLFAAAACWWLFGVLCLCALVFFSTILEHNSGVLLGTAGIACASYVLGLFPKTKPYAPTLLMNGMSLLSGAEKLSAYRGAILVAAALAITFIAASLPIMNKRTI